MFAPELNLEKAQKNVKIYGVELMPKLVIMRTLHLEIVKTVPVLVVVTKIGFQTWEVGCEILVNKQINGLLLLEILGMRSNQYI